MRVLYYTIILPAVVAIAIYANYWLALAGAPQQQWFFCHVLEVCGGSR